MKLMTSRFGEIEFEENEIINFPEGLIGFYDKKRFIFYDYQKENPFKWLQNVDDGELAFIIVDPDEFITDYEPKVLKSDLTSLGLGSLSEAELCVMVVVPEDPQMMYANLLGPLVVNREARLGKQVILATEKYTTCHYILEELKKSCGVEDAGIVSEDK